MRWRGAATAAAWVAVVGVASGLGALSLAGTVDRGARAAPLDDAAVRQKLAAARSASPGPSVTASSPSASPSSPAPSPPTAPTAPVTTATLRVTGGSLTAQCRAGGRVYLTAWSPATGYHVDEDVARGPAATAAVEFEPLDDEGGDDRPYEIHCAHGRPEAAPAPDRDDD
ncbi:hypothetical protein AB0I10_16405 [Streptomyces sp. NPDC050636]|uniref:hypothetical protein n=1 Tax=Streptomyces sp. NPDC050636 TaxID=3154510 RepID=UPI003448DD44